PAQGPRLSPRRSATLCRRCPEGSLAGDGRCSRGWRPAAVTSVFAGGRHVGGFVRWWLGCGGKPDGRDGGGIPTSSARGCRPTTACENPSCPGGPDHAITCRHTPP